MSYEPEMVEFAFADDIVLKATRFDAEHPSVGTQHKHTRDHISVVLGPFAVQIGDPVGVRDDAPAALIGGPGQPMTVTVEADRFHRFHSLAPGGVLLCIMRGDTFKE